ncbi:MULTISPECIES: sensor domain-containing diguanylate cyclase [unclassified Parafrankia]|uniref:diguanylate cyclase domain-containing protein n=1 Tax=unclassified Parafrankia TaxID=2994368 RepID=UPI000DA48376|nr:MULTISPECIES: sensor domain-containing diguanylate cyclase [unclassified Parafrankia]TCJ30694.1 diguanylate cyclase [Parafrankia sp. BMG5.11]SQD95562.1 Diguanylate cyclase [Parafrankia sp. Ea1.12]
MTRIFAAGSKTGRLMMSMDWSNTPLGPLSDWEKSLRMAVGLCLESHFPLEILWGPDLVEIHNDAVIPMLGRKHPGCIGQPFRDVFPEAADRLVPMLEQVMSGGEATWEEDWPSRLNRHGYLEDCYFTFSYSPIRRLPAGGVAGVFAALQETTRQVLGTRRLRCLHELVSATAGRPSQAEVFTQGIEVLGRFTSDIPYCLVVLEEAQTRKLAVTASAGIAGATGTPYTLDPGDASGLGDSMVAGRTQIVARLLARLALRQSTETPPSTAAMVVPLPEGGDRRPVGLLIFGTSDRLPLNADYRSFLSLVATQISAASVAAQSAERERLLAADAHHRAFHDALTELPNRAAMFAQLERTIAETGKSPTRAGFLFVDLDGFKRVNDTLGHLAGDDLLRDVAGRLRRVVRPGDVVARLAGDEFGVLCRDITSCGAVEAVADRIVATVDLAIGCQQVPVTASVGIAMIGPGTTSPEDVVRAADAAMYLAKRRGRGYWRHAAEAEVARPDTDIGPPSEPARRMAARPRDG